jgi:hypothetical protein
MIAVEFAADGMLICKQRLVVNYWKGYLLSNKYILFNQSILRIELVERCGIFQKIVFC